MRRVTTILCPLIVGRHEILEQADQRFEEVAAGHGRMLLISGEAGIGKSRLVDAIQGKAAARGLAASGGYVAPRTATLRAMDFAGNRLTRATRPRSRPRRATPPTRPRHRRRGTYAQTAWRSRQPDRLFWDESTDDQTDPSLIEYPVFVNAVYDSSVVGFERQIVYGTPNSFNAYSVVAVDESNNGSAEASIVVDNR